MAEKVVEMVSSRSELGELRQKCDAYQVLAVVPSIAWIFLSDKHINLTYLSFFSLLLSLKLNLKKKFSRFCGSWTKPFI